MYLEVHGAGLANKGAELMLRATLAELRLRLPEVTPAIDPTYAAYSQRGELGLFQILPPRTHVGTLGFAKRFRKQRLFSVVASGRLFRYVTGIELEMYGCVTLASMAGLLDLAGFAYTDEWGTRPTEDFAALSNYYRVKRKPIILLPQAFGPFRRQESRTAFKKIVDNATLVYARDQQSYDYALEVSQMTEKVFRAPDITLFYPDIWSEERPAERGQYVCIVPNIRILDQGKRDWGDRYKIYLTEIARALERRGILVHLVVHDASGEDLRLTTEIHREIGSPGVTIVEKRDPVALKEILAGSLIVIGSRYHSLVSAFSRQVPAIALGWSHKYEMLFRDFGCEKYVISPESPLESVLECVWELADSSINSSYRQMISKSLKEMFPANQAMWTKVVSALCSDSA